MTRREITAMVAGKTATLLRGCPLGAGLASRARVWVHDRGPLRGADLGRLARGLAEGLTAIHGQDVVHRDLKPDNVMLVAGDPVIIDFGIARSIGDTPITDGAIGTLGYMPPGSGVHRDFAGSGSPALRGRSGTAAAGAASTWIGGPTMRPGCPAQMAAICSGSGGPCSRAK